MTTETKPNSPVCTEFFAQVKPQQTLWALQDSATEDWVVLDSIHFENTDVLPLWSTQELAQQHCIEEWSDYTPAEIKLADWFEFWLEDLSDDGVIVGVDWPEDGECLELELDVFSQGLAEVETL